MAVEQARFRVPSPDEILGKIPQQKPFRFVDQITAVDEFGISGTYRFRDDEWFYAGHFPGRPITPGVILLESMCQVGVVAHGIYLVALENATSEWGAEAARWTTLFSDAELEFLKPVFPGDTVQIQAERIFWRRNKLRSKIEMYCRGERVAQAIASGIGVRNE